MANFHRARVIRKLFEGYGLVAYAYTSKSLTLQALRMSQCRIIPYFGMFLRDLYAIVNDMPATITIGYGGELERLKVVPLLIY
jgi:hypothetical protein